MLRFGADSNIWLYSSIQKPQSTWLVKSMETLEFIIYPDGKVEEKVTGIVGASCAEVTAAIEAQLGIVLTNEPTSEYFAAKVLSHNGVANTQATFSDW